MSNCPHCGAELETPLGCGSCAIPLATEAQLDPFAVFGLTPSQELEVSELERRHLQISRWIHPDYFAASPELRLLAEKNTGLLNGALESLGDPIRRADHLVRSLNGPTDSEVKEMPQAFLMEVLDWNEALEEARDAAPGSAERARAFKLLPDLEERKSAGMSAIQELLQPLPGEGGAALTSARQELNAIRYLDRALNELEALRLAEAETH